MNNDMNEPKITKEYIERLKNLILEVVEEGEKQEIQRTVNQMNFWSKIKYLQGFIESL